MQQRSYIHIDDHRQEYKQNYENSNKIMVRITRPNFKDLIIKILREMSLIHLEQSNIFNIHTKTINLFREIYPTFIENKFQIIILSKHINS